MAWEATAFTELQDHYYSDAYDSFCFTSYTATRQSVSGSLDGAARVNGFRITFTGPIQPEYYRDTSCVWVDDTSIDVKFYGPSLAVSGETLTLDITNNVAEIDPVAVGGIDFQFLTSFAFSFHKKDETSGSFVTSVEVDAAAATGFWTDYKDTRELC